MLEETLKNLPQTPGVYQFFDTTGKLLYIGKAKVLKNRVRSYFRFMPELGPATNLSLRIAKMITETARLEYLIVNSEHDAFILENSLIKQLKPKYNILMRDDKTYPYIYINLDDPYPRFEITRKVIKGKNIRYFGPFSSGAKDLFNALYLLFPLVQKKGCDQGKKACLFHQIHRCHAPCEGKISRKDYLHIVHEAMELIHKRKRLLDALHVKMMTYASNENYEEAASMRDMIQGIEAIEQITHSDLAKLEDFDLFALHVEQNIACGISLFIREGKIVSSSHNIVHSSTGFDQESLYRQMLLRVYSLDAPLVAKSIITAHPLEEAQTLSDLLSERHQTKIKIKHPIRGEKKHLCDLALTNAKELISKHQQSSSASLLQTIQTYFNLMRFPETIEVFDNSHLGGSAAVGAIVTWEEEGFNKEKYRHYHLESKDEYAQMKELLTQRALRFEKEGVPDLWVIDGGETLLELAHGILESVGVTIDVIAIAKEKIEAKAHRAKGSAKDKLHTKERSYNLPTNDKKLQFFQRLRDEAHRFAINFHRKTKRKEDKHFSILKQQGLSDAKIKKLLLYYGTFEAIHQATYNDIKTLIGKTGADILFWDTNALQEREL